MPLYKEWSPDIHSLAAIWHIGEDEIFFRQATGIISAVKHPRKRIEHLAGRYLLQHLKEDFPLHHIAPDVHDKPRLPEDQYFFNISHSYPYVAAVISDIEECGIDIQTWHPRMAAIAHMFLSVSEQALCRNDARLMTLAWSAKEAAYKWYGRRGVDFIRDLPIQNLPEQSDPFHSLLNMKPFYMEIECFGNPISLGAALYKDFALAYLIRPRLDKEK